MPAEPSQDELLQAVYGYDRSERDMEERTEVIRQQVYAGNMPGETVTFPKREADELVRRGIATLRAPDAPPADKMIRGRSRKTPG